MTVVIRTRTSHWTLQERTLDTAWETVKESTAFSEIVAAYMAPREPGDTRGYVARRLLKNGRVVTDDTSTETQQLTLEGA